MTPAHGHTALTAGRRREVLPPRPPDRNDWKGFFLHVASFAPWREALSATRPPAPATRHPAPATRHPERGTRHRPDETVPGAVCDLKGQRISHEKDALTDCLHGLLGG